MKSRRGRYVAFTTTKARELVELRETRKMTFEEISVAIGVPRSTCQKQYALIVARRKTEAAQKLMPPIVVKPRVIVAGAEDEARLPRARLPSVDDDIRKRIVLQGLTAGAFGDPPPGRSALDQRRAS